MPGVTDSTKPEYIGAGHLPFFVFACNSRAERKSDHPFSQELARFPQAPYGEPVTSFGIQSTRVWMCRAAIPYNRYIRTVTLRTQETPWLNLPTGKGAPMRGYSFFADGELPFVTESAFPHSFPN